MAQRSRPVARLSGAFAGEVINNYVKRNETLQGAVKFLHHDRRGCRWAMSKATGRECARRAGRGGTCGAASQGRLNGIAIGADRPNVLTSWPIDAGSDCPNVVVCKRLNVAVCKRLRWVAGSLGRLDVAPDPPGRWGVGLSLDPTYFTPPNFVPCYYN